jgi:hypothetical protein
MGDPGEQSLEAHSLLLKRHTWAPAQALRGYRHMATNIRPTYFVQVLGCCYGARHAWRQIG